MTWEGVNLQVMARTHSPSLKINFFLCLAPGWLEFLKTLNFDEIVQC